MLHRPRTWTRKRASCAGCLRVRALGCSVGARARSDGARCARQQLDQLVLLIESPIFSRLRLRLLEPKRHPELLTLGGRFGEEGLGVNVTGLCGSDIGIDRYSETCDTTAIRIIVFQVENYDGSIILLVLFQA